MATQRTHSIKLSVDSTYVIIKDLTTLDEYVELGILSPENETTDIYIELIASDGTTLVYTSSDHLHDAQNLRDTNGLKLTASDFGSTESTFKDDLWDITIDWTFGTKGLFPSTKDEFFFSEVENNVVKAVASGDWKDAYNYRSKSTYSKTSLRYKRWLDQLKLANNQGLLNEGKTLLSSLKSIF